MIIYMIGKQTRGRIEERKKNLKSNQTFREPVILNIYDMFWTNDYTANVGLGVNRQLLHLYFTSFRLFSIFKIRFTTLVWKCMAGNTLTGGTHSLSQVSLEYSSQFNSRLTAGYYIV